ncbi:hypothetical protein CLF_106889 [Clonorchis sinensis]|uniref:Uncharacterized protein n=1 Tax=Clonorchis sinensis TaxID=79923 RepID=G7YFV8_CLOSI|nr:hypothetical protein CLF_106889 [Clonorchis sinensis]
MDVEMAECVRCCHALSDGGRCDLPETGTGALGTIFKATYVILILDLSSAAYWRVLHENTVSDCSRIDIDVQTIDNPSKPWSVSEVLSEIPHIRNPSVIFNADLPIAVTRSLNFAWKRYAMANRVTEGEVRFRTFRWRKTCFLNTNGFRAQAAPHSFTVGVRNYANVTTGSGCASLVMHRPLQLDMPARVGYETRIMEIVYFGCVLITDCSSVVAIEKLVDPTIKRIYQNRFLDPSSFSIHADAVPHSKFRQFILWYCTLNQEEKTPELRALASA